MDKHIRKIFNEIKSVKIQGATNVAIAVSDGIRLYLNNSKETDPTRLYNNAVEVGTILSRARENEPLARNAVKYVTALERKDLISIASIKTTFESRIEGFMQVLSTAKNDIVNHGVDELAFAKTIMTHCHSSTAENIIKAVNMLRRVSVISTETRPLYQGRITSKNLVEAGVKTTMIIDDAIASYLVENRYGKVDAVVVGCDELSPKGELINKVGTLQVALAARYGKVPVYVVTTLLKINLEWTGGSVDKTIELRDSDEVWANAPIGLEIINPAFEIVQPKYISGYITEAGVLGAKDLKHELIKRYPWVIKKVSI